MPAAKTLQMSQGRRQDSGMEHFGLHASHLGRAGFCGPESAGNGRTQGRYREDDDAIEEDQSSSGEELIRACTASDIHTTSLTGYGVAYERIGSEPGREGHGFSIRSINPPWPSVICDEDMLPPSLLNTTKDILPHRKLTDIYK